MSHHNPNISNDSDRKTVNETLLPILGIKKPREVAKDVTSTQYFSYRWQLCRKLVKQPQVKQHISQVDFLVPLKEDQVPKQTGVKKPSLNKDHLHFTYPSSTELTN